MSREALQDFLRAIEHHQPLRRQARSCRDDDALIQLARSHGFLLTAKDLASDQQDSRISSWFERSRIPSSFRPQRTHGRCHPAE